MPHSHTALTRALLPLAALALSATACASIEPHETTGLYEVFTGSTTDPWCGGGSDAHVIDEDPGLVGPHFALTIMCHYIGDEFPDAAAEDSPELADLPRVIDGAELLIAQFAYAAEFEPETEAADVGVSLEFADGTVELGPRDLSGAYVAVTVPTGADAVLRIEDEGRTQGLDLRTAKPVEPIEAYYNGLSIEATDAVGGYEYDSISLVNSRYELTVTCSSEWAEARRSVWSESRGWAPDGKVFLTFAFRWCGAESSFDSLHWRLDREESLRAVIGDEPHAPLDWTETEDGDGWLLTTVVFEIPAEAAEVDFHLAPIGELEAKGDAESGGEFHFADTPEPGEWEVSF